MEKKFRSEEIGMYTDLYVLTNIKDKSERFRMYLKLVIVATQNLILSNKQSILINENQNGGIIIGKKEYYKKALSKLRKANPTKIINVISVENLGQRNIIKVALDIQKKKKTWELENYNL